MKCLGAARKKISTKSKRPSNATAPLTDDGIGRPASGDTFEALDWGLTGQAAPNTLLAGSQRPQAGGSLEPSISLGVAELLDAPTTS